MAGYDPVNDFASFLGRKTPLLVIQVQGPHLSRGYMNVGIGSQVGEFFNAHP